MSSAVGGGNDPRFRQFESIDDDMGVDLARTHGFTGRESPVEIDPDQFEAQHQHMLGYAIQPPFVGVTEGMHPKRRLPPEDCAQSDAGMTISTRWRPESRGLS